MDPRGTTESALAPSPLAPSTVAAPQVANDQAREKQERTAAPESLDAARAESPAKRRAASGPPPPVAVDRLRDEARARADNAPARPSAKAAAPAAAAPSEADVDRHRARTDDPDRDRGAGAGTGHAGPTADCPGGTAAGPTAVAESANASAVAARAAAFASVASADQRELLIQTADGSTRWWVRSPGTVQRSTDGGARWEVQATGIPRDPERRCGAVECRLLAGRSHRCRPALDRRPVVASGPVPGSHRPGFGERRGREDRHRVRRRRPQVHDHRRRE